MGYIEIFFHKTAEDLEDTDIQNFIDLKIEENLNLDYKHFLKYENFDDLCGCCLTNKKSNWS